MVAQPLRIWQNLDSLLSNCHDDYTVATPIIMEQTHYVLFVQQPTGMRNILLDKLDRLLLDS